MKNERLLVFGGSFDPPHQGHMALLRNAAAAVRPGRVLVIPSGTAPHKRASATPGPLRAAMCACFRQVFPGAEVSPIEIERPGRSYTVHTLARLQAENPGARLYLSIGGDMLLSFAEWYHYKDILRMATLVAQRRGEEAMPRLEAAADALRKQGGQVVFAPGPVVPAASSAIRRAVAEGKDVSPLVPEEALKIIRQNRLYTNN